MNTSTGYHGKKAIGKIRWKIEIEAFVSVTCVRKDKNNTYFCFFQKSGPDLVDNVILFFLIDYYQLVARYFGRHDAWANPKFPKKGGGANP